MDLELIPSGTGNGQSSMVISLYTRTKPSGSTCDGPVPLISTVAILYSYINHSKIFNLTLHMNYQTVKSILHFFISLIK